MKDYPVWINRVALFSLPVLVAWFGLTVGTTLLLIGGVLLWRWLITLIRLINPPKNQPNLILSTISASHFVEKVRWCMDRLGVEYTERPAGGTLGVFLLGRTVPVLHCKTGMVYSSIGNSSEILAYLWGQYAASRPAEAAFLKPTLERRDFEDKLNRYGANLQVWVYYHILPHRDLTLQAWGANDRALPLYQRFMLRLCFPIQKLLIRKAFKISPQNYAKCVQHIETLLAGTEASLIDGQKSLLGGSELNYTDFCFAALSGLWLQPETYGGGKAEAVRVESQDLPAEMKEDIQRWTELYPLSSAFVTALYRDKRLPNPG